jgi:hypothetical protein
MHVVVQAATSLQVVHAVRQASDAARRTNLQRDKLAHSTFSGSGWLCLRDRLEPAEPHRDQFPNTGLSIRSFVDHREPLCLFEPSGRTIRPLGLI